jgi:hypothetical protein
MLPTVGNPNSRRHGTSRLPKSATRSHGHCSERSTWTTNRP